MVFLSMINSEICTSCFNGNNFLILKIIFLSPKNKLSDVNKTYIGNGQMQRLQKDEWFFFFLQVHDQQRDLHQLQRQLGKAAMECEELSQTPSLKGKVIYDENDPQRPRFSLPELRDILQVRQQRNQVAYNEIAYSIT